MEPLVAPAPVAPSPGPRFTVRAVLADAWTVWRRGAGPLFALALLLHVPIAVSAAISELAPWAKDGPLLFVFSCVTAFLEVAVSGALALAGARALRREPLRAAALAGEGLRRVWSTFKVLFLSSWMVVLGGFGVLFLVAVSFGPRALEPMTGGSAPGRSWFWTVVPSFVSSLVMVRYLPALPTVRRARLRRAPA